MLQIFDSADEKRWYEKSLNLLKKRGEWKAEDNKLWLSTLNMIFAEFANVMIEEDLELDFEESLYENDVSKADIFNLFNDNDMEIPIEVIKYYIEVNGLKGFPLYGLDDIVENIGDYDITGFFSEYLFECYSYMKSIFIKVLEDEFDSNATKILLFFYCNTENQDVILKWKEAGEFFDLTNYDINGNYIDEEDDDNEHEIQKMLYDFVCIDEKSVYSVYSWIENGLV